MSQITKTQDTSQYVLPRLRMYFAELNDDGDHKGQPWTFIGNVPEMTLTMDTETLEHYSSTTSLSVRDLFEITQLAFNGSATVETMSKDIITKFFAANEDTAYVNPAITGFADQAVVGDGQLVVDTWYMILDANGDPAMDIETANVTLSSTNGTPVVLVAGTDYVLDEALGQVYFKAGTNVDAIIAGTEGVTATLVSDAGAKAVSKLEAGEQGTTTVAVRCEQLNARSEDTDAVDIVYVMHKVSVGPDGDFSMVSDDLQSASLSLSVESSDVYSEYISVYDLRTTSNS